MNDSFFSPSPRVKLTKAFTTPFRNVVATAKTCYSSKGVVNDGDVGEPEKFTPLARSIYEAGHHTTYQHACFQFALENVSRQFIWSFLHSHPFYNSEQVSQRYVPTKKEGVAIPALGDPKAQQIFSETVDLQFEAYDQLCRLLEPSVEEAFFDRFNRSERMAKSHRRTIKKKAMEVARYVLPLATHAYLYHTISAVTLFRYWRMANTLGVPVETRMVVGSMVEEVLRHDPEYEIILQEPLSEEVFAEYQYYLENPRVMDGGNARAFRQDFDSRMGSHAYSKLVGFVDGAEDLVADAVREVLCAGDLSREEAIALAMNPAKNKVLGESLNLTTHDKVSRAMHHAHYTFKKRLSHTADSQDQRHRMTPASRPALMSHCDSEPDFITPPLLEQSPEALALYQDTMNRIWGAIENLRELGVSAENRSYLLPNAVTVRFTESTDLLNLRHKHVMRLCYNAQEEIWRASVEEAAQIKEVQGLIGQYLLPPCTLRAMAKTKPICPEGNRYCGVVVWKKDLSEYERLI
jgi:thymidylate synthase ThyX